MKNKHALVIGAISIPHANIIEHGYDITWLLEKSDRRHVNEVESTRCINIFNYDAQLNENFVYDLARTINQHRKIDVVIAFHDDAQVLAIKIAELLGLPNKLSAESVINTQNKQNMREILTASGIPSTPSAFVSSTEDVTRFIETFNAGTKFIIKPNSGTGSEGIYEITNLNSSLDSQILSQVHYPALIESFIEGREFSVEGISIAGNHHIIAITEKFKHSGTYMESGHLIPARLDAKESALISEYVASCLTALKITHGLNHSEIILSQSGPVLIETHTRGGGDRIADLVKLSTGVDLFEVSTRLQLGLPVDESDITPNSTGKHACINFLVQDHGECEIVNISGIDTAEKLPGVVDITLNFKVGQTLPKVAHSFDRAASVLVTETTGNGALALAKEAIDLIKYETR